MKLAVWVNLYEEMPYYEDWKIGIAKQIDKDFDIYFSVRHATDNADAVLCLDIDDIPEPALVHIAKINARSHDVTAFAMKLVNEQNEAYARFGTERPLDLDVYNIWGFGNTVYRSEILKELLPVTTDWDTVKRAHKAGAHLHFERIPLIRYRQYGQTKNLVRLGDDYVWGKLENFESEPE